MRRHRSHSRVAVLVGGRRRASGVAGCTPSPHLKKWSEVHSREGMYRCPSERGKSTAAGFLHTLFLRVVCASLSYRTTRRGETDELLHPLHVPLCASLPFLRTRRLHTTAREGQGRGGGETTITVEFLSTFVTGTLAISPLNSEEESTTIPEMDGPGSGTTATVAILGGPCDNTRSPHEVWQLEVRREHAVILSRDAEILSRDNHYFRPSSLPLFLLNVLW